MAASYKKLFKLLIDREIKKTELASKAQISSNCLAKLSKTFVEICSVLNPNLTDAGT